MTKRRIAAIAAISAACLIAVVLAFRSRTPYPLNLVEDLLSDDFYVVKHATESFPEQGTAGSKEGALAVVAALDDPAYADVTPLLFNVLSYADREMCRTELIMRLPKYGDSEFAEIVEVINPNCFSDDAETVDKLMTLLETLDEIDTWKRDSIRERYEGIER